MTDLIYKKAAMAAVVLAALALLTSFMPARAFAGTNVPVTVDISVTYIVDGNAKTAGGDRFTLTADDPLSPMPEGTEDGKRTIDISSEGSYSFGDICYDRPGVHWYTISRELTKKKGVTKDSTEYKAKVIALNDGHGYVLVFKSGSDEKQELVYKDRVAPKTGDNNEVLFWCAIVIGAALSLAVFAAIRIKSMKRE